MSILKMLKHRLFKKPVADHPREYLSDETVNVRFLTDFGVCNYSCPYCISGHYQPKDNNSGWGEDNFRKIIDNLAKLPLHINVRIGVQGEFFLNKTLVEGARFLSRCENVRGVNIITNLSFSIKQYETFLAGFDRSKLAVVASFHPTEVKDRGKWYETAVGVSKMSDFSVVLVAWPPAIPALPSIKAELNELGIEVAIQGFTGPYDGKDYPAAYTEEDRKILREIIYSRHDYEFWINMKKPGLCNAGYRAFFVEITGRVLSCGMGKGVVIGNMLDGPTVELFDKPCPCAHETCFCDTENLNVVAFSTHYKKTGLNQHKYVFNPPGDDPSADEWTIEYK